MLFTTITLATAAIGASGKKKKVGSDKKASRGSVTAITTAEDSPAAQKLRNQIFPTLYAIFQQTRGSSETLKIKNRSLRSLLKSCLYHKAESQLQRTLEDADTLLHKYCQRLSPQDI